MKNIPHPEIKVLQVSLFLRTNGTLIHAGLFLLSACTSVFLRPKLEGN